ncbi:hypothetical protein [Thioflexithrix psekupsensis]|uniref:hypothetical protein n=1 Tax=Thioflexithrix psekupsensis TaxID=1570016 RepID=UPI001C3CE5F3|nr:hypothetical protein [Thioflexithrix psekupsensis]
MQHDFDVDVSRADTDSIKWRRYPSDVLPLWVADMDFTAPPGIIDALQKRVQHGVFGYGGRSAELAQCICERVAQRYQWPVSPDEITGVGCWIKLGLSRCGGSGG